MEYNHRFIGNKENLKNGTILHLYIYSKSINEDGSTYEYIPYKNYDKQYISLYKKVAKVQILGDCVQNKGFLDCFIKIKYIEQDFKNKIKMDTENRKKISIIVHDIDFPYLTDSKTTCVYYIEDYGDVRQENRICNI